MMDIAPVGQTTTHESHPMHSHSSPVTTAFSSTKPRILAGQPSVQALQPEHSSSLIDTIYTKITSNQLLCPQY